MNKTTTSTDWAGRPLSLGWRLRMALESSELSQEDMAELVESHRTTLTRWMHDEIIPKRLYLKIWADATEVPYEWFEEALPSLEPAAASPVKANQPAHKSRRRRTSTRWDMEYVDDALLLQHMQRWGGNTWAARCRVTQSSLDAVPVP